jgi:hypothetical protein
MFTEKDHTIIEKHGISLAEIDRQLDLFKRGIDYINLIRPATVEDGISSLNEDEAEALIEEYETGMEGVSSIKFVPASGAASRMFKDLFNALEKLSSEGSRYIEQDEKLEKFFTRLREYPFYEDLKTVANQQGEDLDSLTKEGKYRLVLEYLLTETGLNYGKLPKGLLKFHYYPEGARTAMEEHYEEASLYLTDSKAGVNLHFTVSPEHLSMFSTLSEALNEKYRNKQGLLFNVSFSIQKPSTDTIAVDLENKAFRTQDGELLFRPGGHGALLENLYDLDESVVFISNIDNVCPDSAKELKISYKKILGGFLVRKKRAIHTVLDRIDKGERGEGLRQHILDIVSEIASEKSDELKSLSNDLFNERAYEILNRPIRVCGMVRNVGEPGGGPFWIRDSAGKLSKQIIESSQIDLNNDDQKEIFNSSTHFNPVELVCLIKDHKGDKFDLSQYTDPSMAFISNKTSEGRELKALEHPGLWNGAMAGWLTWFVEIPLETFTPVKKVFDLIRPEHK